MKILISTMPAAGHVNIKKEEESKGRGKRGGNMFRGCPRKLSIRMTLCKLSISQIIKNLALLL
jgi:hypothetical protein